MTSPDTLAIRDAVDADGPALSRLIAAIFADYEGVLFLPEEFPELAAIATTFTGRGGRMLVAEADGLLVGSLGLAPTHDPAVGELLKVYVARGQRGRGIAARLLAVALDEARARGMRAISLWSDAKFIEGHRFYERRGFARGPGVRALHDASQTLEFNFRLDPIPPAATP